MSIGVGLFFFKQKTAYEMRISDWSSDVCSSDLMTEALLHFAARREHLLHQVWPALEAGTWVISDRFADSTLAYQGYGHGLGRSPIEQLYKLGRASCRERVCQYV